VRRRGRRVRMGRRGGEKREGVGEGGLWREGVRRSGGEKREEVGEG